MKNVFKMYIETALMRKSNFCQYWSAKLFSPGFFPTSLLCYKSAYGLEVTTFQQHFMQYFSCGVLKTFYIIYIFDRKINLALL